MGASSVSMDRWLSTVCLIWLTAASLVGLHAALFCWTSDNNWANPVAQQQTLEAPEAP